jgi:hypothetical protein
MIMQDIFETKQVDILELLKKHKKLDIAGFGTLYPGAVAEEVFGPSLKSSDLFLYLFRRFGMPRNESHDDYKEACAYWFTTLNPDLFLHVSIKAGADTCTAFGYVLTQELSRAVRREIDDLAKAWREEKAAWIAANDIPESEADDRYKQQFPEKWEEIGNLAGPLCRKCNEALTAVFKDFLRPTYIRDEYFNVLGVVYPEEFEYKVGEGTVVEMTLYKGLPLADYAVSYMAKP